MRSIGGIKRIILSKEDRYMTTEKEKNRKKTEKRKYQNTGKRNDQVMNNKEIRIKRIVKICREKSAN